MVSDTQHTPTPYFVGTSTENGLPVILAGPCIAYLTEWSEIGKADLQVAEATAEFICLACNAHDDLLAACEACLHSLENAMCGAGNYGAMSKMKARDAIAKAKPHASRTTSDAPAAEPEGDQHSAVSGQPEGGIVYPPDVAARCRALVLAVSHSGVTGELQNEACRLYRLLCNPSPAASQPPPLHASRTTNHDSRKEGTDASSVTTGQ